jgi:hypothetical protein
MWDKLLCLQSRARSTESEYRSTYLPTRARFSMRSVRFSRQVTSYVLFRFFILAVVDPSHSTFLHWRLSIGLIWRCMSSAIATV